LRNPKHPKTCMKLTPRCAVFQVGFATQQEHATIDKVKETKHVVDVSQKWRRLSYIAWKIAAANPTMSPTTPPPSATKVQQRSMRVSRATSTIFMMPACQPRKGENKISINSACSPPEREKFLSVHHIFVLFPIWKDARFDCQRWVSTKGADQFIQVKRPDTIISHDEDLIKKKTRQTIVN
jgi:hypothetical protein